MKFSMKYIILYVNDFEKSMDFYNGILAYQLNCNKIHMLNLIQVTLLYQ